MFSYGITVSILACLSVVSGHGGGMHYIIDDVVHKGNWDQFKNTEGSIQRQWEWNNAITGMDVPEMACGNPGLLNVKPYHAPLQAGNIVRVNYSLETVNEELGRPWTFGHPYGPMLAYLAACPDEGCEEVDVNSPIWFKIWQSGLLSGNWVEGRWGMTDVFEGANIDIPIPASLKPGKYLLRHEMINLQTGPVQWFPNCVQLDISSSGSSVPAKEDLVAFPGGYDKDLNTSFRLVGGAEWFYVTHAEDTFYPMPGPPVWQG